MQQHTEDAWTKPADTHVTTGTGTPVVISIQVIEHQKPDIPVLTNGHVMLALYAGVVYMSETRSFSVTKVEIYISEVLIGIARFIKRPRSQNVAGQLPKTLADIHVDNLEAHSNIDDRGRYEDATVPRLAIDYEFTGRKVNSEDTFTCLMEAFMILSYDGDVNFHALNAVSASGNAGLNIHHTDRLVPGQWIIKELVLLLTLFCVDNRRFEGIEFDMWVRSRGAGVPWLKRAAGFFLRTSLGVRNPEGNLTAT